MLPWLEIAMAFFTGSSLLPKVLGQFCALSSEFSHRHENKVCSALHSVQLQLFAITSLPPYLVKKFLPYFCQWSFRISSTLCLRTANIDSHARTAHSPSFSRMWSEPVKGKNRKKCYKVYFMCRFMFKFYSFFPIPQAVNYTNWRGIIHSKDLLYCTHNIM